MRKLTITTLAVSLACLSLGAYAQDPEEPETLKAAPNRRSDEGKGPFKTMVIRGATLIDGTGGPPRGPVDIVIEGNHIAAVRTAGTPGLPPKADRDPKKADFEIDATGQYVLPGFVDLHVHAGSKVQNEEAEYAYKLWLGHGVTTVRGVPLASQVLASSEQKRSAGERNRGAPDVQLPVLRHGLGQARARYAGNGARVRPLGGESGHRWPQARLVSSRDHGRAPRRSEEARPRIGRAPRPGRRRTDERHRRRPARPRHGHPLLRPLRVAPQGLRGPALARQSEQQRRIPALRPGRAPVGQDPSAGVAGMEGVSRGAPEARHHLRSHAHHLLGRAATS